MSEDKETMKEPFWLSNDANYYRGYNTKKENGKEKFNEYIDIFYKNEEVLSKSEDDGKFSEKDFDESIKHEVLKFINQSFDNIVVLLGAGASVTDNEFEKDDNGINISGATVAKIAHEVDQRLAERKYKFKHRTNDTQEKIVTEEIFTLDEIIDMVHYEYRLTDKDFNLENVISLIMAYEKFCMDEIEKFRNTKNAIFDIIIKATSYNYNKEIFRHVRLIKILSSMVKEEHKLNIVTTNYDTLIEDAADSMDFTIIDGFSFSQTPKFNSNMFDWHIVKDVPNVKTHQNIYMKNVINLLKIHGSLTWEWSKSKENIIRKDKKLIKKPIMVFPSSDKYAQSYQEPYFDLFAKFQELLKQPNTLLITAGFSFADNHISKMILSAIQGNESLATLVTDFNIDSNNDNWLEMVQKMNDSYRIAFLRATLNYNLADFLGGEFDDN
ncbi:SIR2 family protein [Lactococcus lactis]|uniref:SIR2 family protein n=1 Tax=Lactococcus lactis TaxID=1358 RepID=UPI0022E47839|nr:SIR2 family protein [Lactococcus lactis]